jgi:hypothetical protein
MNMSKDLAAAIIQPLPGASRIGTVAARSVRFGQGTVVAWNSSTFENAIKWQEQVLDDLPILSSIEALAISPGEEVSLLIFDGAGRGGATSLVILGRWIVPGGSEFGNPIPPELSASVINCDVLNADAINVGGLTLDEYIQERVTEQVPDSDPDPPPGGSVKMTETYPAIWSQAYQGDNSKNTFNPDPAQGYFSSTNGNQRSLIGFSSSAIQSGLSAATEVTKVEVYLYFDHWYFNSGGTAIIGHHGHNSEPSSFSATTDQVRSSGWPKPGGRWVTYNVGNGDWATGAKRGISIGPGPSTSKEYYGRARGYNESAPPRLRITWNEPE